MRISDWSSDVCSSDLDNPGGGAPGDSTVLLALVLASGVDACVGPLWDPATVAASHAVGLGGKFKARLGGKAGPNSGMPLDLDVEVEIGIATCRERVC